MTTWDCYTGKHSLLLQYHITLQSTSPPPYSPQAVHLLWRAHGWSGDRHSGSPGRGSMWRCSTGNQTRPHRQRTLLRRRSRPGGRYCCPHCRHMTVSHMDGPPTWREDEKMVALQIGLLVICLLLQFHLIIEARKRDEKFLTWVTLLQSRQGEKMWGLSKTFKTLPSVFACTYRVLNLLVSCMTAGQLHHRHCIRFGYKRSIVTIAWD